MKVKFLCLNLFEGGIWGDKIKAFIEKEKPDILALQEVYNGTGDLADNLKSMEVLGNWLPSYENVFDAELLAARKEGKIDIGNAVFSKFEIKNSFRVELGRPYGEYPVPSPNGDYSQYPKNIQCVDIDVGGAGLRVCNLHGLWDLDGDKDSHERLEMSRIIVEQIKDSERVILAGDFNVKPNTETIGNIEKNLVNVFKNDLETSFNLKRKNLNKFPGYASAVVDMVFVSEDLKVVSKRCPDVDVSDHLPLLVELEV